MQDYFAKAACIREIWINVFVSQVQACPSGLHFTTVWFEGGDQVQWILIDCFGFLEIISPRMRHGNQIANHLPGPYRLL